MKVAGETIESTPGHPFWVVSGEDLELRPTPEHVPIPPWQSQLPGRWVDAGDLRVGDVLYLKSGQLAPIEELTLRPVREMVYNFQVEELESYAVGTGAVLVHNASGDEGPSDTPSQAPPPDEPTARTGSGKNDPHGRPAGSGLDEQLAKAQRQLDELNRTQGSRREKKKLQQTIINLRKEIKKMPKGETHGRRGKKGGRCPKRIVVEAVYSQRNRLSVERY